MAVYFSGKELMDIAIRIEKNGAAFYDALADMTEDATVQEAYRYLAGQERQHLETFRSMFGSGGNYRLAESCSPDAEQYLRVLVDAVAFTDDRVVREMARKARNSAEALEMALSAEKDTILFYYEMLGLVRESDRYVVDRVIAEEKSHMRQLADLKRILQGVG